MLWQPSNCFSFPADVIHTFTWLCHLSLERQSFPSFTLTNITLSLFCDSTETFPPLVISFFIMYWVWSSWISFVIWVEMRSPNTLSSFYLFNTISNYCRCASCWFTFQVLFHRVIRHCESSQVIFPGFVWVSILSSSAEVCKSPVIWLTGGTIKGLIVGLFPVFWLPVESVAQILNPQYSLIRIV